MHSVDNDLISEISLDDSPAPTRHSGNFFKLTESWQRISFIWLKEDKNPNIIAGDCLFKEGHGFFLSRAATTVGPEKVFWESLGETRRRFATAIYVYPVVQGRLDVERFRTGADVASWDFAAPVLEKLKAARRVSGSLGESDWKVRAVGPRRHFEIEPDGSPPWGKNEKVWTLVRARLEEVKPLVRPARALSTDEVANKLGLPSPFAAAEVNREVDFDFLLSDSGSV
jgi:hypothetical protein